MFASVGFAILMIAILVGKPAKARVPSIKLLSYKNCSGFEGRVVAIFEAFVFQMFQNCAMLHSTNFEKKLSAKCGIVSMILTVG